jgi:hypothetical protein
MRRIGCVVAATVMLLTIGGCTYHRAYIDYEDKGGDIQLLAARIVADTTEPPPARP